MRSQIAWYSKTIQSRRSKQQWFRIWSEKSCNQKKCEARRAIHWGTELASFYTPPFSDQIPLQDLFFACVWLLNLFGCDFSSKRRIRRTKERIVKEKIIHGFTHITAMLWTPMRGTETKFDPREWQWEKPKHKLVIKNNFVIKRLTDPKLLLFLRERPICLTDLKLKDLIVTQTLHED